MHDLSNPDISRTGNNAFPGFVPEARPTLAHNYEIGVKWDFFGGVLFMDSKRKISQALDDARRAGTSGSGDYGTFTSTDGDHLASPGLHAQRLRDAVDQL